MKAVNEPNVEVHFTAAERLTEHCIIGADGSSSQELDTIVCATGFDTTYRPRFNLVGQDGISLAEKFTPTPESYFGVSCPGQYMRRDACWESQLTPTSRISQLP